MQPVKCYDVCWLICDKRSSRGPMLRKPSDTVIKGEKDTWMIINVISNITNVSQLHTLDVDN